MLTYKDHTTIVNVATTKLTSIKLRSHHILYELGISDRLLYYPDIDKFFQKLVTSGDDFNFLGHTKEPQTTCTVTNDRMY